MSHDPVGIAVSSRAVSALISLRTWLPAACCLAAVAETILDMQSGCTEDLLIGPERGRRPGVMALQIE
jgi:hypothetical protein